MEDINVSRNVTTAGNTNKRPMSANIRNNNLKTNKLSLPPLSK